MIAGSQLKAGGNTSLDAANDILLSGAANTQNNGQEQQQWRWRGCRDIGAGGNGAGISVFASVNAGKRQREGNGTEWTEATIDSGKTVTIQQWSGYGTERCSGQRQQDYRRCGPRPADKQPAGHQ